MEEPSKTAQWAGCPSRSCAKAVRVHHTVAVGTEPHLPSKMAIALPVLIVLCHCFGCKIRIKN
jgi:hypothetical protein